jgi:hypothetical protein
MSALGVALAVGKQNGVENDANATIMLGEIAPARQTATRGCAQVHDAGWSASLARRDSMARKTIVRMHRLLHIGTCQRKVAWSRHKWWITGVRVQVSRRMSLRDTVGRCA